MEKIKITTLTKEIEDWRIERCKQYPLDEILFISFCSLISGAESFTDMEEFGNHRIDWLRKFLKLEDGIPSHDTFRRIFMEMQPDSFHDFFIKAVSSLCDFDEKEGISFDGKKLRGIKDYEHKDGKYAFYIVNAFSHDSKLCLGQKKVRSKSNEITATPELLSLLDVENKIITIDAMGTQTDIAEQIIDSKADYILSVKGNQGLIFEEIKDFFEQDAEFSKVESFEEIEKAHGRVETRRCFVCSDLALIQQASKWKNIQSIIKIQRERYFCKTNEIQQETAYYISSLDMPAQKINKYIRGHWSVENNLHWVLDVVFKEDSSRVRSDYAPENLSLMRKLALNFIKKRKGKISIKRTRYKATMSTEFLEKLIFDNSYNA